nr:xRN1 5'-3' exonuclease [Marseillevirus cajuinensis]
MGVPGLFYWIQEKYPQHTKTIQKREPIEVQNLYIDAVCFVHSCAQDVHGYGKSVSFSETYKSFTEKQKEQEVFRLTRNAIFALTKYVKPTKRFCVLFDGVAPVGKQAQQRHRRFLGGPVEKGFDPNSITCGTEFLDRLQRYVKKGLENFCSKEKFELIFSDTSIAGEGEHKALSFARENGPEESHCFYSPDGDLVILAMTLEFPKTWLLRKDHVQQWKHLLTDISGICREFSQEIPIKDFVFLSCLLGNDFLPRLGMFEGKFSDTAEFLLAKYKQKGLHVFSRKTGKFLAKNTFKILKFLGTFEKELFDERCYFELTKQKEERVDRTLLSAYDGKNGVDMDKYKEVFALKKQRSKQQTKEYFRGCLWVTLYYTQGCPDNGWSYKYFYPPFLSDIEQEDLLFEPFEQTIIPNQLLQLLCVLPPHSSHLLPRKWKKYACVYKKEELAEFYPKEIEVDYEGKFRPYESVPLIPHVDIRKIQREVQKIR